MANVPKGKKGSPPPPKKSFIGKLRPVELAAIGILAFALLFWGMSKCGKENPETNTAALQDSTATNRPNTNNTSGTGSGTTVVAMRPLYVILDSLKLRKGPHLDSAVVRPLLFGQEVYDTGKRTDFEQTLKVSPTEKRTAPWIQIRTTDGVVGWVFGAGLEFYRKSRVGENPSIDVPLVNVTVTQPNNTTATNTTVTVPTNTTVTTTTVTQPNRSTTTTPNRNNR